MNTFMTMEYKFVLWDSLLMWWKADRPTDALQPINSMVLYVSDVLMVRGHKVRIIAFTRSRRGDFRSKQQLRNNNRLREIAQGNIMISIQCKHRCLAVICLNYQGRTNRETIQ